MTDSGSHKEQQGDTFAEFRDSKYSGVRNAYRFFEMDQNPSKDLALSKIGLLLDNLDEGEEREQLTRLQKMITNKEFAEEARVVEEEGEEDLERQLQKLEGEVKDLVEKKNRRGDLLDKIIEDIEKHKLMAVSLSDEVKKIMKDHPEEFSGYTRELEVLQSKKTELEREIKILQNQIVALKKDVFKVRTDLLLEAVHEAGYVDIDSVPNEKLEEIGKKAGITDKKELIMYVNQLHSATYTNLTPKENIPVKVPPRGKGVKLDLQSSEHIMPGQKEEFERRQDSEEIAEASKREDFGEYVKNIYKLLEDTFILTKEEFIAKFKELGIEEEEGGEILDVLMEKEMFDKTYTETGLLYAMYQIEAKDIVPLLKPIWEKNHAETDKTKEISHPEVGQREEIEPIASSADELDTTREKEPEEIDKITDAIVELFDKNKEDAKKDDVAKVYSFAISYACIYFNINADQLIYNLKEEGVISDQDNQKIIYTIDSTDREKIKKAVAETLQGDAGKEAPSEGVTLDFETSEGASAEEEKLKIPALDELIELAKKFGDINALTPEDYPYFDKCDELTQENIRRQLPLLLDNFKILSLYQTTIGKDMTIQKAAEKNTQILWANEMSDAYKGFEGKINSDRKNTAWIEFAKIIFCAKQAALAEKGVDASLGEEEVAPEEREDVDFSLLIDRSGEPEEKAGEEEGSFSAASKEKELEHEGVTTLAEIEAVAKSEARFVGLSPEVYPGYGAIPEGNERVMFSSRFISALQQCVNGEVKVYVMIPEVDEKTGTSTMEKRMIKFSDITKDMEKTIDWDATLRDLHYADLVMAEKKKDDVYIPKFFVEAVWVSRKKQEEEAAANKAPEPMSGEIHPGVSSEASPTSVEPESDEVLDELADDEKYVEMKTRVKRIKREIGDLKKDREDKNTDNKKKKQIDKKIDILEQEKELLKLRIKRIEAASEGVAGGAVKKIKGKKNISVEVNPVINVTGIHAEEGARVATSEMTEGGIGGGTGGGAGRPEAAPAAAKAEAAAATAASETPEAKAEKERMKKEIEKKRDELTVLVKEIEKIGQVGEKLGVDIAKFAPDTAFIADALKADATKEAREEALKKLTELITEGGRIKAGEAQKIKERIGNFNDTVVKEAREYLEGLSPDTPLLTPEAFAFAARMKELLGNRELKEVFVRTSGKTESELEEAINVIEKIKKLRENEARVKEEVQKALHYYGNVEKVRLRVIKDMYPAGGGPANKTDAEAVEREVQSRIAAVKFAEINEVMRDTTLKAEIEKVVDKIADGKAETLGNIVWDKKNKKYKTERGSLDPIVEEMAKQMGLQGKDEDLMRVLQACMLADEDLRLQALQLTQAKEAEKQEGFFKRAAKTIGKAFGFSVLAAGAAGLTVMTMGGWILPIVAGAALGSGGSMTLHFFERWRKDKSVQKELKELRRAAKDKNSEKAQDLLRKIGAKLAEGKQAQIDGDVGSIIRAADVKTARAFALSEAKSGKTSPERLQRLQEAWQKEDEARLKELITYYEKYCST